MRYLRKRLTCVNRNDYQKNVDAMQKIRDRYVKKMEDKGWSVHGQEYHGNSFFVWEHIIRMKK